MTARKDWVWMPHAAHLIVGPECRFHLATYVGGYIVSTVGEYLPDSDAREIFAVSRGILLEGKGDARDADYMKKIGFEQIGVDRLYETMVFKAVPSPEHGCCPYMMESGHDIDFEGYNSADAATEGHYLMCDKWAKEHEV